MKFTSEAPSPAERLEAAISDLRSSDRSITLGGDNLRQIVVGPVQAKPSGGKETKITGPLGGEYTLHKHLDDSIGVTRRRVTLGGLARRLNSSPCNTRVEIQNVDFVGVRASATRVRILTHIAKWAIKKNLVRE